MGDEDEPSVPFKEAEVDEGVAAPNRSPRFSSNRLGGEETLGAFSPPVPELVQAIFCGCYCLRQER